MRTPAFILTLLLILTCINLNAQKAYTVKKFKDTVFKNILYGTDTNFAGNIDSLKLDIYKPLGDTNCQKPLMIAVHGGAWISGSSADANIVALCHEFTSRGYVVAAINYRLGVQPASYYVPYAACIQPVCTYAMDSSEYTRALYRAMQDTKGAIRFMKNRRDKDSTDPENTYLLGESAGAFTTLMAAYVDQPGEKTMECFSQADAPVPDSDLNACVPSKNSRKRPDLGSIDGKLNLGQQSAKVKGVAAFYGGALNPVIFDQASPSDTPIIYFYHQTCDVIVDPNKGKLFWKLYYYCYDPANLCQPFTAGALSWGSTALKNHFDTMKGHAPYYEYHLVTSGGSYSCNPNVVCHGIDNVSTRAAEIAPFFANNIQATGNTPSGNCYLNNKYLVPRQILPKLYPTLVEKQAQVYSQNSAPINYTIFLPSGVSIYQGQIMKTPFTMNMENLSPGIYFVALSQMGQTSLTKIVKLP